MDFVPKFSKNSRYLNRCYLPTMRTEKDISSKNPETTAVSGFCYAIFQGEIQKISLPQNDLWGGLELNTWLLGADFAEVIE